MYPIRPIRNRIRATNGQEGRDVGHRTQRPRQPGISRRVAQNDAREAAMRKTYLFRESTPTSSHGNSRKYCLWGEKKTTTARRCSPRRRTSLRSQRTRVLTSARFLPVPPLHDISVFSFSTQYGLVILYTTAFYMLGSSESSDSSDSSDSSRGITREQFSANASGSHALCRVARLPSFH